MLLTKRARVAIAVGLVVLGAIVAVGVQPGVWARYHLRRATAAEVRLGAAGEWRLSGHALAFSRSTAARELLPEILARAREETGRDGAFLYRALVFEPVITEKRQLDDETSETRSAVTH